MYARRVYRILIGDQDFFKPFFNLSYIYVKLCHWISNLLFSLVHLYNKPYGSLQVVVLLFHPQKIAQ